MASGKVIVPSKAITKKKEKANKKLTWTDQDTDVFAEVIYDPQYRGSDFLFLISSLLLVFLS